MVDDLSCWSFFWNAGRTWGASNFGEPPQITEIITDPLLHSTDADGPMGSTAKAPEFRWNEFGGLCSLKPFHTLLQCAIAEAFPHENSKSFDMFRHVKYRWA